MLVGVVVSNEYCRLKSTYNFNAVGGIMGEDLNFLMDEEPNRKQIH